MRIVSRVEDRHKHTHSHHEYSNLDSLGTAPFALACIGIRETYVCECTAGQQAKPSLLLPVSTQHTNLTPMPP